MIVKELIEELQKYDSNKTVIIMVSPGADNGYSPLGGVWEGSYIANSTYAGEMYLSELSEADKAAGYTEEDVRTDGEPVIVLDHS